MSGDTIILIGIILCIVALLWEIYEDKLAKLIFRIGMGAALILLVNFVVPQYAVGINLVTLGCAGILGVPGIAALYIIMLF